MINWFVSGKRFWKIRGLDYWTLINIKKNSHQSWPIFDISSPKKFEKYIEDIKNSHKIHIQFQFEEKSLRITDEKHDEIGFIRPGHYSYHGLEKDSHLESVIHPPFREK